MSTHQSPSKLCCCSGDVLLLPSNGCVLLFDGGASIGKGLLSILGFLSLEGLNKKMQCIKINQNVPRPECQVCLGTSHIMPTSNVCLVTHAKEQMQRMRNAAFDPELPQRQYGFSSTSFAKRAFGFEHVLMHALTEKRNSRSNEIVDSLSARKPHLGLTLGWCNN